MLQVVQELYPDQGRGMLLYKGLMYTKKAPGFTDSRLEKNIGSHKHGYFLNVASSRSGHNFIKDNIQSWTGDLNRSKRYYENMENMIPENVVTYISSVDLSLYPNSIKILLLRDLLNWFSSISHFLLRNIEIGKRHNQNLLYKNIVHAKDLGPDRKDPDIVIIPDDMTKEQFIENIKNQKRDIPKRLGYFLDRWLCMAEEWIGKTSYIPEFTRVYYDDFFQSREYRKRICSEIGGQYNETHLNIVTRMGKYSTFDEDKFQGRAQQMKVLYRYNEWIPQNSHYLNVLKEHEALEFYIENFELNEDKRKFIDSI